MVIESICSLPPTIVMGGAALLGALVYSGVSILGKRKEKDYVFDWKKTLDTMWQSTLAGVGAGLWPVSYSGAYSSRFLCPS